MALQRLNGLIAACTVTLALSGCSSAHLYNSERHQQGEAARQAWSEVDLQASIDAERANLKKLLAVELDTQQKLASAIRDHELRAMVQNASLTDGLVAPIDERLKKLVGTAGLQPGAWDKVRASELIMAKTRDIFRLKGVAAPTCDSLADGATPKDLQTWMNGRTDVLSTVAISSSLAVLRTECDKHLTEATVYASFKDGALGIAWAEYRRAADELAARKKEVKGLRETYDAALKDYDQAVKGATADPSSAANVQAAVARVSTAIESLKASSSPYAAQLLAQEHLKSIDAFAQAVTEAQPGQALPKDAGKTAAAFIVIPGFFDEARLSLAAAKKPLMLPLLLRRNYEQLNLEAAKRDIAATEAIVSLSHDLVEVLYQQAEQLGHARAFLHLPKVALLHKESFYGAFEKGGMAEREALCHAAARYLDAVNRLDGRRYKLEYMRIAAHHERTLSYAEINAKQWQSLIGTAVGQVADYSASGFKPEQVANFLNTLGIFYIGAGVNK